MPEIAAQEDAKRLRAGFAEMLQSATGSVEPQIIRWAAEAPKRRRLSPHVPLLYVGIH